MNAFEQSKNKNVQSFLKYLATQNANSDFTKKLEKAVFTAKVNESWRVNYMTLGMKYDEFLQQGLAKGLAKGREQSKLETARNFIKMNFPLEQIAQGTGLSLEKVKELSLSIS